MRRLLALRLLPATALSALGLAACGPAAPQIEVEAAWARPTRVTADAGAETGAARPSGPGVVYVSLSNRGRTADRLIGAKSPVCETTEIHQTTLVGDRMRMQRVEEGIEIPARGSVELAPGGYHLMLFGLRRHLRPGETFEIVLEFSAGGPVSVPVEVRNP